MKSFLSWLSRRQPSVASCIVSRSAALALSLCCAAVSAPAVESDNAPKTASFRFLKFSEVPDLCVLGSSGKWLPVEAYSGFLAKPVRLRVDAAIALHRRDEDGNPVKLADKLVPPLGVLKAVDAPKQIVVLFGDAKKVEARAVADMPDRFPYGRVLAVNLTDDPLVADIGGAVVKVAPKSATLCAAPVKLIGVNNMSVGLYREGDLRKRFYSSVWVHNSKVRTLAFIFKNEAGQSIVRTIVDEYAPMFDEAAKETHPRSILAGAGVTQNSP